MNDEQVSYVIVCYNADRYVGQAIDSILNDGYGNVEVVVADNNSSDRSAEVIEARCRASGGVVKLLKMSENVGPFVAANRAASLCCGKYIARLDADDLNEKGRTQAQVDFLEKHRDVLLVGGAAEFVAEDMEFIGIHHPMFSWLLARQGALLEAPFMHSTVMFRADSFRRIKYYEAFSAAGDYELISRFSMSGRVCSIDNVLIKYRVLSSSITATRRDVQRANAEMIRWRNCGFWCHEEPDTGNWSALADGQVIQRAPRDCVGFYELLRKCLIPDDRWFMFHAYQFGVKNRVRGALICAVRLFGCLSIHGVGFRPLTTLVGVQYVMSPYRKLRQLFR